MEDEKLAAYYDELTRKGGGAARFKQGLGFCSSTKDDVPARGAALPTSASSFLSSFVKASSPSKFFEFEKQAQLQSIQDKLSKKPTDKFRNRESSHRSRSPVRDRSRDRHSRRRSKSRSGSRDRHPRRRSSGRSPGRDRHSKRRSRSRSRSRDRHSRRRSRSRSRDRHSRRRSTSRDRVSRPRSGERSKRSGSPEKGKKQKEVPNGGRKGGIDFAKSIEGYDRMFTKAKKKFTEYLSKMLKYFFDESTTPAERVKAKMKLQLLKTAENDETMGKGSGWERFDFNVDAPLDDEEVEAAEDDAVLVKHIGQSFRFSTVERRKEEEIKAAHDEAMFGVSSFPKPAETNDEREDRPLKGTAETTPASSSLLSDQVLTMQQGSWRDRARKT